MRTWTAPRFAEIRMDAEIGAYQDDFEPERDIPAFVTPSPSARAITTTLLTLSVALSGCARSLPEGPDDPGATASAITGPLLTQHNDNARTGANLKEQVLTPANVSQRQFGYLYSLPVTGSIYGQPLIGSNVRIQGLRRPLASVMYVATMHNMVYAFNAAVPTPTPPLLSRQLEAPTPNTGATGKSGPEDPTIGNCYNAGEQVNVPGEIGILSTPVIVNNTMYVITNTGAGTSNQHWLHALDVSSLADVTPPVQVTHPGGGVFPSYMHVQRTALLAANNQIYATFGSYCDVGTYHGYVIGFDQTTLHAVSEWNDTPQGTMGAGGIWQSGQGPAADSAGNVYLITGNGKGGAKGHGNDLPVGGLNATEAMVKLSPNLAMLDWFVPHNYHTLDDHDLDFGSGGPLLLPNSSLVLGGGKYSTIYVAEQSKLGKFSTDPNSDPNVIQSLVVNTVDPTQDTIQEIHGAPVYWNGPNGPSIYVWATNDNLKSFRFDGPPASLSTGGTTPTFDPSPVVAGSHSAGNPGAMLSISALGSTNGIVWAARPLCDLPASESAVFSPRPGRLMAFDASNVTHLLWDSASAAAARAAPSFAFSKNASPAVANGKVYLPSFANAQNEAVVMVYGPMPLLPSQFAVSTDGSTVTSNGGSLAASQQFGLSNTDVFAIDKNGQLNVAWVAAGGQWEGPSEPTNKAGSIQFPAGAPLAVAQQLGTAVPQTDVFAVDTNGNLNALWVDGGGSWQGPSPIGASCAGHGNACTFPLGAHIAVSQQFPLQQTDVFIVDNSGALTVSWIDGSGRWQSSEITGQGLFPPGAPLAASQQLGLNQTDVFIVDLHGKLDVVYNSQAASCTPNCPWAGPALVGNGGQFPVGAFIAASQQFGLPMNTDVFAVDTHGTLNVAWVNGANPFNGPTPILQSGQFPPGAPLAASQQFGVDATGQTDVFAVDKNGLLKVMWVEGANGWQGPATVGSGGSFIPGASIAVSQQFGVPAQTDVFVVDANGNRTVSWAQGGNPFNGPSEIPSSTTESSDAENAACSAFP